MWIPFHTYTVRPVLRGHPREKEKVADKTGDLKRGSIHMKLSMTGEEKGDCLIEVTIRASLTRLMNLLTWLIQFNIKKPGYGS